MIRPGRSLPPRRGFSIAELFVVTIIIAVLVLLCLPAVRRAPGAARRTNCKNNLKNISLALHNYHDVFGHYPPAYTLDDEGNRLHSWRTLLLPYLDEIELFESIDLTKPWDHPANAAARETDLEIFRCPAAIVDRCESCYVGVLGPDAFFNDDGTTRRRRDIEDGASKTFAIAELPAEWSVHWMDPNGDIQPTQMWQAVETDRFISSHSGGFHVALVDGSVRFISASVPPETMDAFATVAGGESVYQLYP